MKDWLLIDTGLDKLSDLGRAAILVFRSGDGLRPEPGDLQRAVDELRTRAEPVGEKPVSLVLVPLEEAHTLEVQLSQRWGINSMAELDLGANVA